MAEGGDGNGGEGKVFEEEKRSIVEYKA